MGPRSLHAMLRGARLLATAALLVLAAPACGKGAKPADPAHTAGAAGTAGGGGAEVPALSGHELTAHFIDVGQGDSILIVSPTGRTVLIDAGERAAAPKVLDVLRSAEVERIDLFVWTHPHADHMGAATTVLDAMPVGRVMDSGYPHTTKTYADALEAVRAKGIPYALARAGRVIEIGGGATITILAPAEPLLHGTRSDANANSAVLLVRFAEFAMILTGDSEEKTERKLLETAADKVLRADVLKVAHHGGKHSTKDPFLAAVRPRVAIISVGASNSYGHPTDATLGRLAAVGATTLRTDVDGTVRLVTDGRVVEVDTERGGDAKAMRFALGKRGPPHVASAVELSALPTSPFPSIPGRSGGTAPPVSTAAPATAGPAPATASPARAGTKFDINTATEAQLTSIKGIGPAKATAIIAYLKAHGPFTSIEDLVKVKGIGPATMEKIQEAAFVGEPPR